MSRFDESVCRTLDVASRRGWLESNGIGGFASSTITGLNTRRYHGLLVAATNPPVGRAKLEETLVLDGRRSRRLASDASSRQAGRDRDALVQRPARYGGPG
jgi:glycogen debranching enzyme